jgi:hypothetical protein
MQIDVSPYFLDKQRLYTTVLKISFNFALCSKFCKRITFRFNHSHANSKGFWHSNSWTIPIKHAIILRTFKFPEAESISRVVTDTRTDTWNNKGLSSQLDSNSGARLPHQTSRSWNASNRKPSHDSTRTMLCAEHSYPARPSNSISQGRNKPLQLPLQSSPHCTPERHPPNSPWATRTQAPVTSLAKRSAN